MKKNSRIYPNRVPIKIPLNRIKRSSKPNQDDEFGAFFFYGVEMIPPVFKSLPVDLNQKTASWLQVLWASKKILGEKPWRNFEEWSKINYVHQNENRNRQI